jgi:hypothetical protein
MARKKKAAAATPAATGGEVSTRTRKKVEKMPEGTFAVKLRVGPITEAHMARLASMKGLKPRKCTRKTMQAHLASVCAAELARVLQLPVMVTDAVVPGAGEDDLLS